MWRPARSRCTTSPKTSLRLNTQANLRDVAEATGGFLVAETNDLSSGLERIGADLRGYYELAYYPFNPFADGTFRTIEVKVARPGVEVRTRRGYFARPPGEARCWSLTSWPWPRPSTSRRRPRDFGHRVAIETVGDESRAGARSGSRCRFPSARCSSTTTRPAGRTAPTSPSWPSSVDGAGRVVTRLSHDWPLSGPLMEAPGVRNQSATVKRTLELAPGQYTLETAVGDRLSGGLSVQRTPFTVPGPLASG